MKILYLKKNMPIRKGQTFKNMIVREKKKRKTIEKKKKWNS